MWLDRPALRFLYFWRGVRHGTLGRVGPYLVALEVSTSLTSAHLSVNETLQNQKEKAQTKATSFKDTT